MYNFDDVMSLFLQEAQSRVNRSGYCSREHKHLLMERESMFNFVFIATKISIFLFTFSSLDDDDIQKKKICKYC